MPADTMTIPRTRQGVRNLDEAPRNVLPISGGGSSNSGAGTGMTDEALMNWIYTVGGGTLALLGLGRGSLPGLFLAGVGGTLLYKGLTGGKAKGGEPVFRLS